MQLKIEIFCEVIMCLLVGILWYLRGLCCFHLQGSAVQGCTASNIVSHPRRPESPATVNHKSCVQEN